MHISLLKKLGGILIAGAIPVLASAQEFSQGGIVYQVTDDSEVEAIAYDNSTPDVTVPATVSYNSKAYTVSSFSVDFSGSKTLRTLTVSPAFGTFTGSLEGCENLRSVSLPLEYIGRRQFFDCPQLDIWSAITQEVDAIGEEAFGLSEAAVFDSIDLTPLDNADVSIAYDAFLNRQYKSITCGATGNFNMMDKSRTESLTLIDWERASLDFNCPMPALKTLSFNGGSLNVDASYLPALESIVLGAKTTQFGYQGAEGVNPQLNLSEATALEELAVSNLGENTLLEVPESVTTLYVSYMSDLQNISGASNVRFTQIHSCPNLKSISLPAVEELGTEAFFDNTNLREVYLGENLKEVSGGVFSGCKALEDLVFGGSLEQWNAIKFRNVRATSSILSKAKNFWYGHGSAKLTQLNELTDLGNATTVSTGAFTGYKGLVKVALQASVTTIGEYAFNGCSALKDVVLEAVNISGSSFIGCTALTNLTLGDELAFIDTAFDDNLSPGQTLTVYYQGEFTDWKRVKRVPHQWPFIGSSNLMELANGGFYFNGKLLETLTLDKPVEITSDFAGLKSLKTLFINCGDLFPVIKAGAFKNCISLSKITYTEPVRSRSTDGQGGFIVEDEAFYNCQSLDEISILDRLESVGADAFYGTGWYNSRAGGPVYLTTASQGKCAYTYSGVAPEGTVVEFEAGTETILPSSYVYSDHEGISGIVFPEGLRTVGAGAFSSSIAGDLTIPASVESFGSQYASFRLDKFRVDDSDTPFTEMALAEIRAKEIYIGRDIQGEHSIFYMPESEGSVRSLTYGPCVTRVGICTSLCTYDNADLSHLYALPAVPPVCDTEEQYNWETEENETLYPAFSGIDTDACVLHVPAGSIEAYRTAPGWNLFSHIVGDTVGLDAPASVSAGEEGPGTHYDLLGRPVSPTAPGLHIIRTAGAAARKVLVK